MAFDFDTIIDRRDSDSSKWTEHGDQDIVPMPVADMDFVSPPEVLQALHERIDHGIFGYPDPTESLQKTVVAMLQRDHDWTVDPSWIVWLPGLVVGLNLFTRLHPDDAKQATVTPIYPPFLLAPANTGRRLLKVPLRPAAENYAMDMAALEAAFSQPDCHGFLLSNPHNPSGRVYTRDELDALATLAIKHDVLVCSDEIHCGLILDDTLRHIPLATLSPAIAERTVTLMAPSKTFNLAGLQCAFAIIPNAKLRMRYKRAARGIVTEISVMGMAACEAAYTHGEPWRRELVAYLRQNRDAVQQCVASLPGVSCHTIEATYLAWLDCRQSGIANPYQHLLDHGLALSDGRHFGDPGFVRLNFGCPRSTLEAGLKRLRHAFEGNTTA
jgi:cystathionine beta-lyase